MVTHSSILAWNIRWTEELVGYSPWGHKESDMTEATWHTRTRFPLKLQSDFRCRGHTAEHGNRRCPIVLRARRSKALGAVNDGCSYKSVCLS